MANIYKSIHDSQKQINTNRLVNINQTPERLKQTTVKNTYKKVNIVVTTQQKKKNKNKNKQAKKQTNKQTKNPDKNK